MPNVVEIMAVICRGGSMFSAMFPTISGYLSCMLHCFHCYILVACNKEQMLAPH
jgi:hypothetical protein